MTSPPDLTPQVTETRLLVLHFSDYHSHAVPFFSEHMAGQGGLARTVAYLKQVKAAQPAAMILSGGDMLNASTPSWSDKYQCVEWPWLNGLVDAMALGNHDVDYGWDTFSACSKKANFPVISANFVDKDGAPVLMDPAKPYLVKQVAGYKIGIFALSGPDFPQLVHATNLPQGAHFTDPLPVAMTIVHALRTQEKVDAVIFIGHQDRESDFAMARAVPGIDLILGTHSHYKGEFQQIPGTATYFISPYQYLNYLSRVELTFAGGKLKVVSGKLVRMDQSITPDPDVQQQVQMLETDLENDPKFKDRFAVIGSAQVELSNDNLDRGESVLGNFAMDVVRHAALSHAAISTASSFRASIPPGPIRMEDYLTALPYKNKVLSFKLTGAEVQKLLDFSLQKRASDNFGVTSGVRYTIAGGKATKVGIAMDPAALDATYADLDPAKVYDVMTTDYIANIAAGYKDIFAQAQGQRDTMLIVNDTVIDYIRKNSPVSAKIEGRVMDTGMAK